MERLRSRRERAPRRSQPSRVQSASSARPTRARRFGSFISSHSQSTMSSTLNSRRNSKPPSLRPPPPLPDPARAGLAEHVARLGGALPDSLLLLRRAQPEMIMLEHAHRHADRFRSAAQYVAAGDRLGQVRADGFSHLVVVAQPIARATRKEVIPICDRCSARCGLAFAHLRLPREIRVDDHSCASNVVT